MHRLKPSKFSEILKQHTRAISAGLFLTLSAAALTGGVVLASRSPAETETEEDPRAAILASVIMEGADYYTGFHGELFTTPGPLTAATGAVVPLGIPLLSLTAEEPPEPEPVMTNDRLLAIVDTYADKYNATGISAAVVENGEVSVACGWGMADLGGRVMTEDTKVRCASISKVVVGLAAMRMAQDGLISLDGSIGDVWGFNISSRAYPDIPISVEKLMTHTSTIVEYSSQKTLSATRSQLSGRPFTGAKPGTVWAYSNYGYGILGTTLELACGSTLENYVQETFLKPMGMDSSFYTASFTPEELASLYRGSTCEWSASGQANARYPQAIGEATGFFCGNFTSSAKDYAKLLAMLANDGTYQGVSYLSPETVADMETPRLNANNGESDFAQCLTLRQKQNVYGQDTLYYHTGSAYGVYALASYNPDTKNAVVVISTGANRSVDAEGIYGLCAAISADVYETIDTEKGEAPWANTSLS